MTHSTDALQSLIDVLDLRQDPGEEGRDTDRFLGRSQRQPWGRRVFGGQVLGQALVAAGRTVDPARAVHSMHAYFLRPGDSSAPISLSVERLRDGRSFSARRAHALQDGTPILSMIASFQTLSPGLDHQGRMPDVPAPESLPSAADVVGHLDHPATRYWARERAMDLRYVETPLYLSVEGERVAHQAVWLKAVGPLPDDPMLHAAVLGYASDYTTLEPVMRRHGIAWSRPGLKVASLDHAMWWHRPARADEWLLYVQQSPSASGGRGLGVGQIFSRHGVLVASVAQEGMLRVPDAVTSQSRVSLR